MPTLKDKSILITGAAGFIGGIGMPLSIVLLKEELDIWKPAEHNGTFRGNQLSFVAGKASLDWLLDNDIEAETRRKAEIVKSFITENILSLDNRIEVRGIGLIWGIDFGKIKPELSNTIIEKCFEKGLICECAGRNGSVVKILPPLVIGNSLLMQGLLIICDSIKETLASV